MSAKEFKAVLRERLGEAVALLDARGIEAAEAIRTHTPALFTAPGVWVIESLGGNPEPLSGFIVAFLISLPAWWFAVHWVGVPALRLFGLFDARLFHWLTVPLWRGPYWLFNLFMRWWEKTFTMRKRPTARWASFLELCLAVYQPGNIYLGRALFANLPINQPVGIKARTHVTVFGGSGAGKTTHIATMLAYAIAAGSNAFVIDIGGQIARTLVRSMGQGGGGVFGRGKTVVVLGPNHGPYARPGSWNVFADIKIAMERYGVDIAIKLAAVAAEGLVKLEPSESKKYFPLGARELIQGLILFIIVFEPEENHHLGRLRELASNGLPEYATDKVTASQALLLEMVDRPEFNGVIAARARQMLDASGGGRGDIQSTMRQALGWLDWKEGRDMISASSFSMFDLKEGDLNIILTCGVSDLQMDAGLSGFFRLLTVFALYVHEFLPGPPPKHSTIFAIDEMQALGNISALGKSAAALRKFGIQCIYILQDAFGLRMIYPKTHKSMIGSSAVVLWMSTNDPETSGLLSETLGEAQIKELMPGDGPRRYTKRKEPLLNPEQARRYLTDGNMIVTGPGMRPMRLQSTPYYKDLPVYLHDPDAYEGEKLLLRVGRLLFTPVRLLSPPRAWRRVLGWVLRVAVYGLRVGLIALALFLLAVLIFLL